MEGTVADQPVPPPECRRTRAGLGLTVAVTFGTLLGLLSPNLAPFQIGALVDQLHFDEKQVGFLTTVELLLVSVITLFSASFFTRISCRNFAFAGVAISLVGQIATISCEGYPQLLLARCLAGVGLGMVYGGANASGAMAANPERFFSIITTAALAILAGFMPAAAYLSSEYGYPAMYAAIAALTIAGAPFLARLAKQKVRAADAIRRSPTDWRRLVQLLLAVVLFNVGTGAVWTYFERAGQQLGLAPDAIGLLAGIAAMSGLAGSMAVAWIGTFSGRTIPAGVVLMLAGCASLLIASGLNTLAYSIGAILYWITYMFMYPLLIGTSATLDSSGRGAAITAGTLMTSYSLGPVVATFLVSASSHYALAALGAGSCIGAALVLLPLTLALDQTSPIS